MTFLYSSILQTDCRKCLLKFIFGSRSQNNFGSGSATLINTKEFVASLGFSDIRFPAGYLPVKSGRILVQKKHRLSQGDKVHISRHLS